LLALSERRWRQLSVATLPIDTEAPVWTVLKPAVSPSKCFLLRVFFAITALLKGHQSSLNMFKCVVSSRHGFWFCLSRNYAESFSDECKAGREWDEKMPFEIKKAVEGEESGRIVVTKEAIDRRMSLVWT
jgi:hypothetical protein